ncbi:MAG: hypothetical protein HQ498_13835 [Pseudohongiella sp.]|nr:hypothetical protein [Pseudohongiella sp.]
MSKLLFRMRGVPEDEAEEVRELLNTNEIEFFETSGGNWGISLPALWLKRQDQFDLARELLDGYQAQRGQRIRQEYASRRGRGEAKTMWQSFSERPFRFTVHLILIGLVLYLSMLIFLSF